MPDFLTRRGRHWHFVRRVPAEFAAFLAEETAKWSKVIRAANIKPV